MTAGLPVALRGALWMVGALLSFSLMAISVRELLHAMGSFEILFLRSFMSLVFLLFLLPRRLAALRTRHFGLHVLRNAFHFGGQYAWVYAISILPLATVFAIEFTMPVWAALLAMLFLGERLNQGRVVMLALGVAGVFVMPRLGQLMIVVALACTLLSPVADPVAVFVMPFALQLVPAVVVALTIATSVPLAARSFGPQVSVPLVMAHVASLPAPSV